MLLLNLIKMISFDVPPTQNFYFASKPFGINWKDLQISKNIIW